MALPNTEDHKLFYSIKKDLRRQQRDYYDLPANAREFNVGQEVLVKKPPPSNVEKGSATKHIRRYAGRTLSPNASRLVTFIV